MSILNVNGLEQISACALDIICRLLVDQLAGRSMKDTASCAKECELQDT